MEKYDFITLVLGIIIGMIVTWLFVKTSRLKTILGFLSQKPEVDHIYEFRFRLSPKHGVFYSPSEFTEFIFSIDEEHNFEEEHFYEYKTNCKFEYLGSIKNKADWDKVSYP